MQRFFFLLSLLFYFFFKKKNLAAAVKLDPSNVKAYWRAASALARLDKHDEVIEWCDRGLIAEPSNKTLALERQKSVKAKVCVVFRDKINNK